MKPFVFVKKDLYFLVSKGNKLLPFFLLVWVLITLCSILYVLKFQEAANKADSLNLLTDAYKDLLDLKERYAKLQEFVTERLQKPVIQEKIPYVPKTEYNILKRRIADHVQEFSYFITSEVSRLKNTKNLEKDINNIVSMGLEYKRVLKNSIEKLTQEDGFDEWRKDEITKLSSIVQERLRYLQNPIDCQNAKKLLCSINYSCGFGCQIHHLTSCLIVAYGLQRTLILKSKNWQYHNNGWEEIFMPLSSNCTDIVYADTWPGNETSHAIEIPPEISIIPRPEYLPLVIPEDLADRLKSIHGNPIVWWVGEIMRYIWKPSKVTTSYIEKQMKRFNIIAPFVGVHIRRTDKIGTEASFHFAEEYMRKVDEYYNEIETVRNITKRRVYIATDDIAAISEAKTRYPQYDIMYNHFIQKRPVHIENHRGDKILDVIFDIHILSQSHFLVCTFSSNICRLAYELMQNYHTDASTRFASLDDVYYYSQQDYNKRKAILSHIAKRKEEIDLLPGDIVHIHGNHWDGYSLGRNLRTDKVGLYPSFKTEIETELFKFPTYSEMNSIHTKNNFSFN